MALGTLTRLSAARELQRTVARAQGDTDAGRRVLLLRRAAALRAMLLGRRVAAGVESLDLFNPTEAIPVLRDYVDGLAGQDERQRGAAGAYLNLITHYLAQVDAKTGGVKALPLMGLRNAVAPHVATAATPEFRAQVLQGFAEAGAAATSPEAVAALAEPIATLQRLAAEANQRSAAAREKFSADIGALRDKYQIAVNDAIKAAAATADPDEQDRWVRYAESMRAEFDALRDKMLQDANAQPVEDESAEQRAAARQALADHGRRVIAAALEASPVTEEQATAWAAAQELTSTAAARLRKSGYDPKQLRQDMADFYRLTGGRLAAVKIQSTGAKRASASEIHGHRTSIVNIDGRFTRATLFHELAHHLEADPLALAAGKGFLEKRREGNEVHRLRDLTGNDGYRTNEYAYKDSWFNPYIGKHYDDATEVFSMGVESFSDPEVLAQRLAQDPEHFALVLGYMRTPPHPLFGAVKSVFAQAAQAESDGEAAVTAEREAVLQHLAAAVQFVPLSPPPELSELDPWTARADQGAAYVGTWEGIHCFRGVFRDWQTKRRKRGERLLWLRPDVGPMGEPRQKAVGVNVFGTHEEARVQALAIKATGHALRDTTAQQLGLLQQSVERAQAAQAAAAAR